MKASMSEDNDAGYNMKTQEAYIMDEGTEKA